MIPDYLNNFGQRLDPWQDLSAWMQKREMVMYCRDHFDLEQEKETATHLIKLIDIAIRNRIHEITRVLEDANMPKMPPGTTLDLEFERRPIRKPRGRRMSP